MRSHRVRALGALTVLLALAVPAVASAHPSVFTSDAQVVSDPANPGVLTPQTRYVVANHGFTYVLRESNGLRELDHRGVFDYKAIPGAYRATLTTWDQLRTAGSSGAQAHATCRVPALESEAAIRAWQGTDPFYAYVPFQKATAGLEDDPATWIPVVSARTGVDLTTVTDAEATCEALPGANATSFVPADATQTTREAFNAGLIEHETAPLTTKVAGLESAMANADATKAALQGLLDAARAEAAKLSAATVTAAVAPMRVALPSATTKGRTLAKQGASVTVTGLAGAPVSVRLTITERQARRLKLRSSVLASAKATIGADGTVSVALTPRKSARRALRRLRRSVAMTVTALSGDRVMSAGGIITR